MRCDLIKGCRLGRAGNETKGWTCDDQGVETVLECEFTLDKNIYCLFVERENFIT